MKKKILLLIMLLVPFLVSAKEEINYGWDKVNKNGIVYIVEDENKYYTVEDLLLLMNNNKAPSSASVKIKSYDPAGNLIKSLTINEDNAEEEMMKVMDKIDILLPIIDRLPVPYYINKMNDKYIVSSPMIDELEICTFDVEPSCINKKYSELSTAQLKKYLGEYYELIDEDFADRIQNDHIYEVTKKYNNHYIKYTIDLDDLTGEISIYNEDKKKLVTQDLDLFNEYASVDINQNGIYFVLTSRDHENHEAEFSLVKYDLSGKEEYIIDLNDMLSENLGLNEEELYYANIINMSLVNGGVILNLNYSLTASAMDYCMNYEDDLEKVKGAILPANTQLLDPTYEAEPEHTYSYCESQIRGFAANILNRQNESTNEQNTSTYKEVSFKGQNLKVTPTYLDYKPSRIPDFSGDTDYLIYKILIPDTVVKLNIDYEITTKVEGKGTVTAISRSEANGLVTFKVEPKKGYVLSVVKVTDAFGNVIEFTDYTFTMPNSDVLIEAVFVPENPYTADIAIVAVLLVAIAGGVLLIKGRKKINWLK